MIRLVPNMSTPRQRLAAYIEARRVELRLRWTDVAERAELSTETLRQIRKGTNELRPLTRGGIDRAMGWARGRGVDAILAGGEPIVAQRVTGADIFTGQTADETAVAEAAEFPEPPATVAQVRQRLEAASVQLNFAREMLARMDRTGTAERAENAREGGVSENGV